ncbi:MAG: ABC transporter permease, partial [Gemmatimonadota bacterium]
MDTVISDLKIAIRQLAKSPGFALIAIATLALGIGANSALFSLVNSVLLRDPGYANPEQLVDVYSATSDFRYATSSNPDYLDLREQNTVFSGVLSYKLGSVGITRGEGETRSVWTETVSGTYFDVLGVRPRAGRLFNPAEDDVVGGPSSVVLSSAFWKNEYNEDPKIVGETLRLNGQPFTVIGVAAPNFRGMIRGLVPAVWTTSASFDRLYASSNFRTDRNNRSSFLRARLKPGVTVPQAQANADAIAKRLVELYPTTDQGLQLTIVPTSAVTFNPQVDGKVTGAAWGLMAIPALVLVIACANLATLLLIRAVGRRREIAVRMALGAGRARVTRQLITESVLLAVLGGAAGLLLAGWFVRAIGAFQPPISIPVTLD